MNRASHNFPSNVDSQQELLDFSLPLRRESDEHSKQVEQQAEQVIELLALDQALDFGNASAQKAVLSSGVLDAEFKEFNSSLLSDASITTSSEPIELSVVIPCLDEADTVGNCVLKALYAIAKLGISGEVVVADNGSRDDSIEIAETLGARVVHVHEKGYGAALMGGIAQARGKFVVMGDADDSYDFTEIPKFYERLCDGADVVQGCRLPWGGGRVMPGAMPWLHQWGNPLLTWMVRSMFRSSIHDVYCGMRGFRKDFYKLLDQRCTGMEFATEMIVKSSLLRGRISEVPITLHRDGRTTHRSHLRTFRDGWRTLRFFMLQSPRWTFLIPGASMIVNGTIGFVLAMAQVNIAGINLDAHTMLVSMLTILVGTQFVACAVLAKTFAGSEGLLPKDGRLERLAKVFTLERCLAASCGLIALGSGVVAWQAMAWASNGFGALDYSQTMRTLIPAVSAIALGVQAAASSFLLSLLRMARR